MEDNQYLVSSFGDLNFTLFTRDGEVVNEDREKPEDGELAVTEMHIFRTGVYKHPLYGLISFTKEDLEEIIRNFKNNIVTEEIPLNENHMKHKPAKGWLARKEDGLKMKPIEVKSPDGKVKKEMGLFGDIALNKDGYNHVVNHKYKYLSAEINQDYQHRDVNLGKKEEGDEEGDESEIELRSYGTTLTGIALTNNPFIPNLDEIDFSNGQKPEDIDSNYIGCDSEYGSDVKFIVHEDKAKDILSESNNLEFSNMNNQSKKSFSDIIYNQYSFDDVKEFRTVEFQDHAFFEDRDKDWDGDEAVEEIRVATDSEDEPSDSYKEGFVWYDFDEPDNFTSYKLPICMADGEELKYVWNGVVAAAASVEGARNKPDIPPGEFNQVKRHLRKVYEKAADVFDDEDILPPPFDETDEDEQDNSNPKTNQKLNNTGDINMEFADIVTKLREFDDNDYESQIDFLESEKAKSDDKSFSKAIDTLIEEKEEAKRQYNKAQKAVQREQRYRKQKEQLEDQVSELELDNQRLQEQSWQHRVEEFCTELEQEGHHQPIVNAIDNKFSSLTKDARETKLEFVDENDEGEKLDVIELTREILSEMPDSARLNENEELQANQDLVVPDQGVEESDKSDESDESTETTNQVDGDKPSDYELNVEGAEKIHDEKGNLDFSKIRKLKR